MLAPLHAWLLALTGYPASALHIPERLMTRTTVLAAILVAAAFTAASARTEPEFSADRIKAHVTFLADDLLEGREAGRADTRSPPATSPASSPCSD